MSGPASWSPGRTDLARQVTQAPKVLLHDHLDGGLRPHTLIELADEVGYDQLPSTDPDELACWFRDSAAAGSLPDYLRCFAHTHAVMQTVEGLFRVASECAQDLAADGVVYAESRFAPDLHCRSGLSTQQVVEAVAAGFADGERRAAEQGLTIRMAMLLCGNRQQPTRSRRRSCAWPIGTTGWPGSTSRVPNGVTRRPDTRRASTCWPGRACPIRSTPARTMGSTPSGWP